MRSLILVLSIALLAACGGKTPSPADPERTSSAARGGEPPSSADTERTSSPSDQILSDRAADFTKDLVAGAPAEPAATEPPPVPLDLAVKLTEPGDHGNTVVIDLRPDPEQKGSFLWIESLTDQARDMTGLKELRRRKVTGDELVALKMAVEGGFYDLDPTYGDPKKATPQTLLVTMDGKVKRVVVAGERNTVFGAVRDALRALAP